MSTYDQGFYPMQTEGAAGSASMAAPTVLDILPARLVCGGGHAVGTRPSTFARHGLYDQPGSDGDCVDRKVRRITATQFEAV